MSYPTDEPSDVSEVTAAGIVCVTATKRIRMVIVVKNRMPDFY